MDQVRIALDWLKKHHFWVLSVVVIAIGATGWWLATASVAARTAQNEKKIAAEFQSMQTLQGQPFKANDEVNAQQEQQTRMLATQVSDLWTQLYARQKEAVLQWPESLGNAFAKHVEGKAFGDGINDNHRERYLNYIQKRFPKLVAIIDARELPPDGSSAGGFPGMGGGMGMGRGGPAMGMDLPAMGGGMGMGGMGMGGPGMGEDPNSPEENHLTEWLDQGMLRARMDLRKAPTSLEIWVLQEDLWVYESLLTAIANTNKATGATRRSRAAVRTLYELQVGRNAAASTATSGRLVPPDVSGAGMAGDGGMMRGGMMADGMMGEAGAGMMMESGGGMGPGMGAVMGMGMDGGMTGEGAGADEASLLLAGRYLDESGAPIMDASSMSFGVEYKRLPVRMTLELDQRWLTRLIAELANAPLQVEIDQLRINPTDSGSGLGGAPPSMRMGAPGDNTVQAFDREPSVATVILQGKVYIFNPPDTAALGEGEADGEGLAASP